MLWRPVPRVTLTIANAPVFEAQGGPSEVEYALFDSGESELRATEPGSIREAGYRTTVALALERLEEAGFTPAIAERAALAARATVARAYARSVAARCVVGRLEAAEMFEALAYDAPTGRYVGMWLDLDTLAADLDVPDAARALRATYLAALLAPLPANETLFLDTSELSAERRAGERTYRRVELQGAEALVDALAALKPIRQRPSTPPGPSGPGRPEVVAWLRARAERNPAAKERLEAIEASLATREAPTRGPLTETALWNLEAKLARGETTGVLEHIDAVERRRGRVPGTLYLRARLALMTGTEDARSIAERVSSLSTSMAAPFHELELLAGQSWAQAGDLRRARAFAHDLQDSVTADDVLRMQAMELMDTLGPASMAGAVIEPKPIVSVPSPTETRRQERPPRKPDAKKLEASVSAADVAIPRPPRAPSGTDVEPSPSATPPTKTHPGFPPASTPPSRPSAEVRSPTPGTSLPPFRTEPRGGRPAMSSPPADGIAEQVELLSTPEGLMDQPLPSGELPRTHSAARVMCTLLARELGRELRMQHAIELRGDVEGLEVAQRYLREGTAGGPARSLDEQRETLRYGAFLAELLARRLGARWVDLESKEPGRWAMLVPSKTRPDEVIRVWPFARVLRFVAMGHKERDLVAYYLELERRSR